MKNKTVDLFYGDNVRLNAHAINNNSPEEIINRFAVVPLNTIKSKQIRNIMVLVKDIWKMHFFLFKIQTKFNKLLLIKKQFKYTKKLSSTCDKCTSVDNQVHITSNIHYECMKHANRVCFVQSDGFLNFTGKKCIFLYTKSTEFDRYHCKSNYFEHFEQFDNKSQLFYVKITYKFS